MKPLNSGHLRVFKKLSLFERCQLLGDNFKKIVTFGTKWHVRYSWYVRYLECPLLGVFTVFIKRELLYLWMIIVCQGQFSTNVKIKIYHHNILPIKHCFLLLLHLFKRIGVTIVMLLLRIKIQLEKTFQCIQKVTCICCH